MHRKIKVAARIIFLFYTVSVLILCFVKFDMGMDISTLTLFGIPQDKIVHFLMFLPLTPLSYASFYKPAGRPWRLVLFTAAILLIGIIAAGGTEVIQGFTGYRSMDISDFRADCIGIFTGSVATVAYAAITKRW